MKQEVLDKIESLRAEKKQHMGISLTLGEEINLLLSSCDHYWPNGAAAVKVVSDLVETDFGKIQQCMICHDTVDDSFSLLPRTLYEPNSRNHRIDVQKIGSGWCAIHLADYKDMDWGTDVVQTGFGRFATADEARGEAYVWALAEGLPFFFIGERQPDPTEVSS